MNQPRPETPRPSLRQTDRALAALIAAVALVVLLALAMPFFWGQVYVADDLGEFHLPLRNFYHDQLSRGEPFDWMPQLFGGFDVAAEGQLGAYHPWHLVLYRWLPLGAAFDIELLASYPLAFAGMYLLLRRALGRSDAAAFGALVFAFCGFNLLHFVHPNAIAIMAHLPWLLWAIGVALTTTNRRHEAAAEAAIALLVASQLLLGYPQYVWLSFLAAAAYLLWQLAARRTTMARTALVALAATLGVAIGAIQWMGTWQALADSIRQAPNSEFANTGSLHPLNVVQLAAPYLFKTRVVGQNTHELGLYLGAVPLVLCVWLAANWRRCGRYRNLVKPLAAAAVMALLLAAGEFGGLYRLQSLVPLANRFRFPCRAIVLVELAVAALAAVAFALVVQRARDGNIATGDRGKRALVCMVLASVALAIIGPLTWPQYVAAAPLVWLGPLLIGAAAALVYMANTGKPWAVALLVILAAADLGGYGMSYTVAGRTADLHTFVADASRPPGSLPARIAATGERAGRRTGDRMLLAGIARVDGYAGLEPAKRLDYRQMANLQLAGADWLWVLEKDEHPRGAVASRATQPIPELTRAGRQSSWVRIEPTAPRARLAARVAAADQLADVPALESNAVTCDQTVEIPPSDAAAPSSVRVVDDRPGRIAIELSVHSRRILATTESYNRSWRATAGGRELPVVRVDGDFLGCVVEPGDSVVEFSFHPRWRLPGAIVAACGLQLLVGLCWLRMRRPKRDPGKNGTQS